MKNKRRAAPSVSLPLGGRTTYVVGLGALMRNKRRAAPSVSLPLGGRTTYVVGLGALSTQFGSFTVRWSKLIGVAPLTATLASVPFTLTTTGTMRQSSRITVIEASCAVAAAAA